MVESHLSDAEIDHTLWSGGAEMECGKVLGISNHFQQSHNNRRARATYGSSNHYQSTHSHATLSVLRH